MNEYLTISGINLNVWVVFASNHLDKAPLQLWEARKTQLYEQPEVLYSWLYTSLGSGALNLSVCIFMNGMLLVNFRSYAKLAMLLSAGLRIMCLLHSLLFLCSCASLGGGGNVLSPLTYREHTDIAQAQSASPCLCL